MSDIANELEYYIGRKPTADEVTEVSDWLQEHPGVNLSELIAIMMIEETGFFGGDFE